MTILEILNQIENESSTNKKLEILKQHKDNELLKQVCYLTYNKLISFYIKKIPEYNTLPFTSVELDLNILSQLSKLYNRETTGNLAIEHLEFILSTLDEDSAEVIKRIIKRDLRCNLGTTQINKVWKDLIPKFPYQRISLFKDIKPNTINWQNGVYSQLKEDSLFCNLNYDLEGNVFMYSRTGTDFPIDKFKDIVKEAKDFLMTGAQHHGELLVTRDGKILDREIGNGILNSVAKGGFFADNEKPVLHIWDFVPLSELKTKCKINTYYSDRYNRLKNCLDGTYTRPDSIKLVETRICYSIDEVIEHLEEVLSKGLEGLVIKLPEATWVDGDNPKMFKIKVETVIDMEAVELNPGQGKNRDTFGSIYLISSDGLVESNISGFTDSMRKYIYENWNTIRGKIFANKINKLLPPTKNNRKYTTFLPRFVEIREDKDIADSLEEIQAQYESSILTIKELFNDK